MKMGVCLIRGTLGTKIPPEEVAVDQRGKAVKQALNGSIKTLPSIVLTLSRLNF